MHVRMYATLLPIDDNKIGCMFKFLISLQHNVYLRRYGPRFCDVGMKGRGDGTEQNTE